MKLLKLILFLIGTLLVIGSNAFGQSRPEHTSSAQAYYGKPSGKGGHQLKKKKKIKNYTHTAPARGTQVAHKTNTKRRYMRSSWAS